MAMDGKREENREDTQENGFNRQTFGEIAIDNHE
jgi:hypothetical protein